MTKNEIAIITAGEAHERFRVLDVNNHEDSLFLRKISIDAPTENIAKNKELQLFIQRLKRTMEEKSGVGIAAPQVGIGRNIFLFIRIGEPDFPVQVAINPRIVAHSEETFCFEGDGCLSIPDKSGNTTRYKWVEVEYYDEIGNLMKEKFVGGQREEDFTGIVFQHEFDHLRGILYTDRLIAEPDEMNLK